MCYLRTDGLWVDLPMLHKGAISGRRINIVIADLSDQNHTQLTTLFLNRRRAVRARYPDGNPETMGYKQIQPVTSSQLSSAYQHLLRKLECQYSLKIPSEMAHIFHSLACTLEDLILFLTLQKLLVCMQEVEDYSTRPMRVLLHAYGRIQKQV